MAAKQTSHSESRHADNTNTKQCKTCGKTHAGKCWKLTGGPPAKKTKFDPATLNMLKEHFVTKEDSDNESGSKPHWGRNLSNTQRPAEPKAFMEAARMLADEARLASPEFIKPFHLYSDTSDRQLGATLCHDQDGKPLGFYTRKLNAAQLNYTVGEKELLGIVEGLKAFEGMLRGQDVIIYTDHLNLLYQTMSKQRMVRWRLLMEEFHKSMSIRVQTRNKPN